MKNDLNLTELGVSPQARFACYAMSTSVSRDLSDPVIIEPGVLALFGTPFKRDGLWTQSLGTLHDQSLADSNLLLIAFSDEASEPELARRLGMIWYALLVQGRAYSVDGLKLGGYNTRSEPHVDSVGSLDDFYLPPKVVADSVDLASLRQTVNIARGIATIFRNERTEQYRRLRKGFNALLRAIKEGFEEDTRLHQFVRAIEAVIKPKRGNTTNQFVDRCKFFAGRSDADRALLRLLFEMRSAAEHLNPMSDRVDEPNAHEREKLIALRVFQAEILAGYLYCRLLTDPALLEEFSNDESIIEFWATPDDELIRVWGPTIDLEISVEWEIRHVPFSALT